MAIDKDAVLGAFIGLTLAASVSFAVEGVPLPSRPAAVTGMGTSGDYPQRQMAWERRVSKEPFGVASRGPVPVERKAPMFAGKPMGKRWKACPYDEKVFSDDCTPRH